MCDATPNASLSRRSACKSSEETLSIVGVISTSAETWLSTPVQSCSSFRGCRGENKRSLSYWLRQNNSTRVDVDYLLLQSILSFFIFSIMIKCLVPTYRFLKSELLLARIVDLRSLYGQIFDGKETKRLFFIAPILETVSRLLGDVLILVEEDVVGKNVLLKGRFEFVLKRGTKRISIVEAKREDMLQGIVQNVTGLEALADVENLTVTYGIVTNYLEWMFLVSEDSQVRKHECTLPVVNTIPSFAGLKDIVEKIYGMLLNE